MKIVIRQLLMMILCSAVVLPLLAQTQFDIVITGGRVIDPETGLNAVRQVGIVGDRIAEISTSELIGNRVIDATGLVVAPGFIDLHSHGITNDAHEFQLRDGVTTALELEWGMPRLRDWIDSKRGRTLVNYGASVAQSESRLSAMQSLAEISEEYDAIAAAESHAAARAYFTTVSINRVGRVELTASEIPVMQQQLRDGIEAGGLGIGYPIGYFPAASYEESLAVFQIGSEQGVPVFVHVKDPGMEGIHEAVAQAVTTGASLHIVHLNSMAAENIGVALDLIESAQTQGLDITTEVYPYTAASTSINAPFLDPPWPEGSNYGYAELQWQDTGERLNRETFLQYRQTGGVVIEHFMLEEWIHDALRRPITMVASDAMRYAPGAHPRGAGTFSRLLGVYVREEQVMSLPDAIRRVTLMPARRLERIAPAMARKGRLQVGADADITVFDPDLIRDTATYTSGLSFSEGILYVLVNGEIVVEEGETVAGLFPGRPVLNGRVTN